MAAILSDYLASVRDRRWKFGSLDCCTFIADWAVLNGLPDPMKGLRGRYSNEVEYLRLQRAEGGFLTALKARLEGIGMRETLVARAGDLIAVRAPYAERRGKIQTRPVGGIAVAVDRNAVVTSDIGLVITTGARLPVLKAWTFQ